MAARGTPAVACVSGRITSLSRADVGLGGKYYLALRGQRNRLLRLPLGEPRLRYPGGHARRTRPGLGLCRQHWKRRRRPVPSPFRDPPGRRVRRWIRIRLSARTTEPGLGRRSSAAHSRRTAGRLLQLSVIISVASRLEDHPSLPLAVDLHHQRLVEVQMAHVAGLPARPAGPPASPSRRSRRRRPGSP